MANPPPTRALTVGDIMSRSVLTTEAGASVAEAAALMYARRVGSVVVVRDDAPIGILTERDLVRFAAGAADARTALVGDYMTADPDTVAGVGGGHRRLPTVRGPRLPAHPGGGGGASWSASSRCATCS